MLDCFTIRLKEAVDNKDLPVAGSVKIHVSSGSLFTENDYKLIIAGNEGKPIHVKALGGGTFSYVRRDNPSEAANNISEADLPSSGNIIVTFAPGDYDALFTPVEDIITFVAELNGNLGARAIGYNLSQFNDATSLRYFNFMNATCSGTFVPQPVLEGFAGWRAANNALNPNVYINIEDFGNCLDIANIYVADCPSITGNIEALYKCTKLLNLGIYASNASGDIKTLFDNMYAAGRISGIFLISVAFNGKITFNGTVITPEWIQSQGGNYVIRATFNSNGYTVDYPV